MSDRTLVRFGQVRPANGGPDWIVGGEGSALVLGKVKQSGADGRADIEVWARSERIYEQAVSVLAGDQRLLTEPKLALLLASGVVMLTALLEKRQIEAAEAEIRYTCDIVLPDVYTANGWEDDSDE